MSIWHKIMDKMLIGRVSFNKEKSKEDILKDVLKSDREAQINNFEKDSLSDCCGYYTYVWSRSYNFCGFIKCSKCRKNCAYKVAEH